MKKISERNAMLEKQLQCVYHPHYQKQTTNPGHCKEGQCSGLAVALTDWCWLIPSNNFDLNCMWPHVAVEISVSSQVAQAQGASWETCQPLDFIRICMRDYVPSWNSNFTEILKLKLPYLVSVCVSLPLQRFQCDPPVSSLPMHHHS